MVRQAGRSGKTLRRCLLMPLPPERLPLASLRAATVTHLCYYSTRRRVLLAGALGQENGVQRGRVSRVRNRHDTHACADPDLPSSTRPWSVDAWSQELDAAPAPRAASV
jgi:hypothetical protein